MTNKILITGTLGFIFSNFIRTIIDQEPDTQFVCIDKCIEKYSLHNIFDHPRHKFYFGDCADPLFIDNIFNIEKPDYVIHGAASSFVDDSIKSAPEFTYNNIQGTQVMIDASLRYDVKKFLFISTDEVYGQFTTSYGSWDENDPINPRNPYSASKASAELMVKSAGSTHKLPYLITRSCNNYGPRQPPRNLLPRIICNLLNNVEIPIHGDGKNIREWIYVDDNCSAIMKVLKEGTLGEIYNIGTNIEVNNLNMVEIVSNKLNIKPNIKFIEDRKGHDFRYSVDCSKIKTLGWSYKTEFYEGINKSIEWYLEHSKRYINH